MKYLKFMPYNSVRNASRNCRELSVAKECGYEAYCYSSDREGEIDEDLPFHLVCNKPPAFEVNSKIPRPIRMIRVFRNVLQHAKRLRGLKMDVISCHNIMALATAWIGCIGLWGKKRPKLIYDSHEFELGKKKRGKMKYCLVKFAEGFLIKRCAFTIVVNEGIGDELVRLHKLNQKPVALRSTPEYWKLDEEVTESKRREMADGLGVPYDSFIVSYTGYFLPYRGLEEVIDALKIEKDVYSVWIGEAGSAEYKNKLEKKIADANIQDRILRYPIQPQQDLWKFVSAASAAMVVMNGRDNDNYKYALPNKFFEAIQSLTPVICSDTAEMARIVKKYDIGLLVPSGNGKAIAEAIQRLKNDKDMYLRFKKNLAIAKADLCWEKEKTVLFEAYQIYL